jgi:hypothetical protein
MATKQLNDMIELYGDTPFVNHLRKKGWSQKNAARYYANLLNEIDSRQADTDRVMSRILAKGPEHMIHINDDPDTIFPSYGVVNEFRWLKKEYLEEKFNVDRKDPWRRGGGKTKRRRRARKSRRTKSRR